MNIKNSFISICIMRVSLVILIFAGSATVANAQTGYDGSIYSGFGIGDTYTFSASQSQGMGVLGAAIGTPNYVNLANPATWSNQILTRFVASADFQHTYATDVEGNTSQLNAGGLGTVALSFPILANRMSVLAGFQPFSRVGYRVRTLGVLETAPADTLPYSVDYTGNGGLQRFTAGFGLKLTDNISVGASVDGYFGLIETSYETSFISPDPYLPSRISTVTRASGFSGTVGGLLGLNGVFSENDALAAGASVALPATLSGQQVRTSGITLDRDTLGTAVHGNMKLPLRATGGIAYSPGPRWLFATDVRYERWSDFSSDFMLGDHLVPGTAYRDRIRAGAGFQVIPAGGDANAPYLSRVAYRLGGYVEQSYFDLIDRNTGAVWENSGLDLRAVTAGMSFPTILGGTRFDVNLEAGMRGTTGPNLVRDLFYRVTATVNFGERWFVKRRLN